MSFAIRVTNRADDTLNLEVEQQINILFKLLIRKTSFVTQLWWSTYLFLFPSLQILDPSFEVIYCVLCPEFLYNSNAMYYNNVIKIGVW